MGQHMIFWYLLHMSTRLLLMPMWIYPAKIWNMMSRYLNYGLSLHLHPYFAYASSKVLTSLGICAGLSEPSLLENVIRTQFSCTGSNDLNEL